MTDLDEINTFLGIHIERNIENGEMQLSQKQYLINVLEKFQMSDCKPISTPMEIKLKLEKGDDSEASTKPYRELIGCLMYVTLTTGPDLAAATNYFSRFQSNSTDEHFMYAKRILKYIKGTLDLKLKYIQNKDAEILTGFADADWAGDTIERKSTSGFVFKVFGGTVAWLSQKQSTVSLSSTEAEYIGPMCM